MCMKKILFFDSGSGGVNVLAHCVKNKIAGDFLYFADTKDSPYGDKTAEGLRELVCQKLHEIYNFFRFDIVVFACNTLTTSAIEFARKVFQNVIFVGTVPAIKPACEKYDEKEVLLMATNRTLGNLAFNGVCVPDLPKLIDENLLSLDNLNDYLNKHLSKYKDKKAVVLGCTHYLAVKNIIKTILPNAEIFDSNEGVAKRLKAFAGEGDYIVQFMESGSENISIFSKYFQNLVNFS